MSFVYFRGTRADLENGLSGFMPERSSMAGHRFHGTERSMNANVMALLITVLLLFMMLNSHQMSQNQMCLPVSEKMAQAIHHDLIYTTISYTPRSHSGFHGCSSLSSSLTFPTDPQKLTLVKLSFYKQLWVAMVVFLLASSLRMFSMCHRLQVQAQASAVAARAGGLLTNTELRLHHDAHNRPGVTAMSDTDVSRLPVRMYKGSSSSQTPATQSQPGSKGEDQLPSEDQAKVDIVDLSSDKVDEGKQKILVEEELTCSVCLEQVVDGEIVRTLPCVHQFHSACIDQWLRQQGTCPVCKFRLNGPETPNARTPTATAFMV